MAGTISRNRVNKILKMAHELLHIVNDINYDNIKYYISPIDSPNIVSSTHDMFNIEIQDELTASSLYNDRRKRNSFFDDDFFAEPAWDILLDLFINEARGRKVSITSSSIAAAVPATTALRWLALLEQRGFVKRTASNTDARRTWVFLTAHAKERMLAYLEHMNTLHREQKSDKYQRDNLMKNRSVTDKLGHS
jgi:hypothetical protein